MLQAIIKFYWLCYAARYDAVIYKTHLETKM